MATATFTGAEVEAEEQFQDAPGEDTEGSQDWLDYDDDPTKRKGDASKSEGKTGDQPKQVEGGAEAPPKENPLPPPELQPGTSKDPTVAPAEVPTQDPTKTTPPKTQRKKHHPTLLSM